MPGCCIGEPTEINSTGGSDAAEEIAEWAATNHTATTVDGVTAYDLTS